MAVVTQDVQAGREQDRGPRIVIAIQDELSLPTRFVGTGEKLEDLAPFDGRAFIANMI